MEGSRLIKLRAALNNMSQEELGERIGLSRSGISNIEKGKRALNDRHIKLICTEFNVNETWLRTGEGEMFRALSPDEEFTRIMMEIQVSEDPLIRRIIAAYWKLNPAEKAAVQKMVQIFVDEGREQTTSVAYIARSGDQGEVHIAKDAQEEALRALDESSDPDL